ncbi:ABC transporter permease [Thermogladius sp. 4427co]|uniref:ABC transporter permease n=1 Tax=Thermogladius sp. 4427co TaxID=3450718 RepID=UPI003F7A57C5
MPGLTYFFIRKILARFTTFFVILTLTFIIPRLLPGGAFAYLIANPSVPPDLRQVYIKEFGLDKPIWEQYVIFLRQFFTTGNIGLSFSRLEPVSKVIMDALPWTISLVTTSLIVSAVVGILTGMFAAYRRGGGFDTASMGIFMFIRSMPGFWLGMVLLIIFGYYLGWAPLFGAYTYGVVYSSPILKFLDILKHMWLPMLTLIILTIPGYHVLMRNSIIGLMGEDFVTVARAKGFSDRDLLIKHVFRPASLPILTSLAIDIGFSVSGVMLIENVFSIPGVGRLAYQAVYQQDYPLLLGIVIYTSALTLILVTIVEVMYSLIDPRVKLE